MSHFRFASKTQKGMFIFVREYGIVAIGGDAILPASCVFYVILMYAVGTVWKFKNNPFLKSIIITEYIKISPFECNDRNHKNKL